jgi:hypothetical protein
MKCTHIVLEEYAEKPDYCIECNIAVCPRCGGHLNRVPDDDTYDYQECCEHCDFEVTVADGAYWNGTWL